MPALAKSGLVTALVLATAVFMVPAQAQNLVKDGTFEAANPGQSNQTFDYTAASPFDSNWSIMGTVGIDLNDLYIDAGNKSLWLNDGPVEDGITQNIATYPGQRYILSFDANADFPVNELTVSFGQNVLTPIVVPNHGFRGPSSGNAGLFTSYSFDVLGTGDLTALTFISSTSDNPETLELDNISVTHDNISVAAVPEASSVISLGLLLLLTVGSAFVAARKKVFVARKTPLVLPNNLLQE